MIRVEVKSEVLGDSIFWEGPENQIDKIRNIVARAVAERVVIDGKTRQDGMWLVSAYTTDKEERLGGMRDE